MNGARGIAAVSVLGILALVVWLKLERREAFPEPVTAMPAPSATVQPEIARAPPEREALTDVDAPKARTARDFLAEYWGDRWAEIEPVMAAQTNIEVPFEFVPWEAAEDELAQFIIPRGDQLEGQIQGRIQWPAKLTCAWLGEYLPVSGDLAPSEEDLPYIQDVAAPFNDEIEVLARDWGQRLVFNTTLKWNRGDFVKAPFSTFGVDSATGFYATTAAGHGWAANLVLTEEDCPDMVELMNHIADLRDARDQRIRDYLNNR